MTPPRLSDLTSALALVLAVTMAGTAPTLAQTSTPPEAAVAPDAANNGVPLPDFIQLSPLTPADVRDAARPSAAEAAPAPAEPNINATASVPAPTPSATTQAPQPEHPVAAAVTEAPAAVAAPADAAHPAAPAAAEPNAASAATGQPAAPATAEKPSPRGTVATAPAETTTRSIDVQSAIPMPETADVPPPGKKDIGTLQPYPGDLDVAEKLKELVPSKLTRFMDRKRDREAIEEFYTARQFAPAWFTEGRPTARALAAVKRMSKADADGLDASDYAVPNLDTLADADARAQAELKLTAAVLNFARQAQAGRTSPSRISTNIEFSPPVPEPAEVLKAVTQAEDVASVMDGFNPQHEGFRALKRKLAELRGATGEEKQVVRILSGPTLRPGQSSDRVPALRERLGLPSEDGNVYDSALVEAVKHFQKEKGVRPDGLVGPHTVELLNGGTRSKAHDIDVILSNMERWRWLPRDLGQAYVMVNIPDYTLKVVRNHKSVFHTRIVVGKPNTPSPNFVAAIENILVNPTWHVPQSIIYNEYLPALKQDPTVLARMGLVMEHNRDGTISIRQPPGERNALGRIKFNFPNRFQVYLHDTPDKSLFNHERRAYSHGCMRVQNPTDFGEALASIALPDEGITSARLKSMFGQGERWLNFKRKIPVYLVYLNAYVDDAGKLVVRPDIYGYDQRVQSALRGQYMAVSERSQRVSPVAMKRARQIVQEVPRQPQRTGFFGFPWFQ